jgi:urease accessory protein
MTSSALLLLADGRFPAGGHAHSGGVEAAIADGRIHDVDTLFAFVAGRLATVGLTEAALAAATAHHVHLELARDSRDFLLRCARQFGRLDAEADARVPCPPLRDASRRLGRSLTRVAARCWPHRAWSALDTAAPAGAHQPIALGTAAIAAGGTVTDAAVIAVHHAVNTPALAGVRLLGLDPLEVAAATAAILNTAGRATVAAAVAASSADLADLPAANGPLLDVAALEHRDRAVRMFAT